MKRLFLVAALVGVAFTSCVKNEDGALVEQASEITFEVAKYKPAATRAEVDFPVLNTFGTFAFYENTETPGHSVYMNNVEIIHRPSEGPGYWASRTGQYFWPIQGHLDFISYSPYKAYASGEDFGTEFQNSSIPTITSTSTGVQDQLQYLDFVNNPDAPIDLMYSDKAMQQIVNTANYGFVGVPTLFHHALSKLNFQVKAFRVDNKDIVGAANATTWEVTLNSIEIKDIYNKGTLTLKTENAHNAGATTVQWANQHTSGKDVWAFDAGSTTSKAWVHDQVLTTTPVLYGSGSSFARDYFILPQILIPTQQKIVVKYTIKTTAPSGQVGTEEYTAERYFDEFTAVDDWLMGKNITYVIDIDPMGDEIHFAPKVVDWVDVSGVISI